MILNFLGRGAAFFPKEGNTSAFFKENDTLFLIDCGESVFSKLISENLLNEPQEIVVLITHTHSDHIGSLASLALYQFFRHNKKLRIVVADREQEKNLETLFNVCGVKADYYMFENPSNFDNKFLSFKNFRFQPTTHVDNLDSSSIVFDTNSGLVFYSGDTNTLDNILNLIKSNQPINRIYIEASDKKTDRLVHLNILDIFEQIPKKYHYTIECMHINSRDCLQDIKDLGLKAVEVYNNKENSTSIDSKENTF